MGMRPFLLALAFLAAFTGAAAAAPWRITKDHWGPQDERGFGAFVTALGRSGCNSAQSCLRSAANPWRGSDGGFIDIDADCAKFPYLLRAYYAWKNGLPFGYADGVSGARFSPGGNRVVSRAQIVDRGDGIDPKRAILAMMDNVYSGTYRVDAASSEGMPSDFYSPALKPGSIRPGTVIYDPNGHLAVVFRIEPDGRIRYIDAHPDNSLTRGFYDLRFVRASPGMGAGFKNWRPLALAGARRQGGVLFGGEIVLAANHDLPDFSLAQVYGTDGKMEGGWKAGRFRLGGQTLDYYDYVRAVLGGGRLRFEPVREIADMVTSNCADLGYRAEAVNISLAAGLQDRPQPQRLPPNIYGTDGDWETYSTPSRDARLKTAFKNLRDTAERFVTMARAHDPRLSYDGGNLAADLLAAYDGAAARCRLGYTRSDGSHIALRYEEARRRLFHLSFDPYHCVERRWGAAGPEAATCRDGALKQAWYEAEQRLRNQIDRAYEARMDFSLRELQAGAGGAAAPPDTDARGYLLAVLRERRR
jgi:hypothetical protein